MAQRGKRSQQKWDAWRQLVQQWRQSGLTIRVFCQRHGVSEPSFYSLGDVGSRRKLMGIARPRIEGLGQIVLVMADMRPLAIARRVSLKFA